jgi:hypothetical protein
MSRGAVARPTRSAHVASDATTPTAIFQLEMASEIGRADIALASYLDGHAKASAGPSR